MSVYQQSVSSRSQSRRYSINTSTMEDLNHTFNPLTEQAQQKTMKEGYHRFQMDVGRFDYYHGFFSYWNFFVYGILNIITSFGSIIMEYNELNPVVKFIIQIFEVLEQFSLRTSVDTLFLLINIFISLLYISFLIYYYSLINEYRQSNYPSTQSLHFWVIATNCILPIFTSYFAYLFSEGIVSFIFKGQSSKSIILVSFGVPLAIIHVIIRVVSNMIFRTTPIFRKNDPCQMWYCFFPMEKFRTLIIYANVLIGVLCNLLPKEVGVILFTVLVFGMNVIAYVYVLIIFPYVYPNPNALQQSIYLYSAIVSLNPIFVHFIPHYLTYIFVIDLIFIPICYLTSRLIVAHRIRTVVNAFFDLHYDPEAEKENDKDEDLINFNLINSEEDSKKVNYDDLFLLTATQYSFYMRIGFMFNVEDINSMKFPQFAVTNFSDAIVVLSACQIGYATQSNLIYLQELQNHAIRSSNHPPTVVYFTRLLNEVRQELLTQLNVPLLEAVALAKKHNTWLQSIISDFWGAVLKQKTSHMIVFLPQITAELKHTENLFQRLIRNYPNVAITYRETSNFYSKSAGDPKKTIEMQTALGRIKAGKPAEGDETLTSEFSTQLDGLDEETQDKTFNQKMDPLIAAQDAIEGVSSTPTCILVLLVIIIFFITFTVPAVIFGIGTTDFTSFHQTFEPVRLFSSAIFAVSRLPQLARRKQLFGSNKIKPHEERVGPPRGVNLEFLLEENTIPSLKKYVEELSDLSVSILATCKSSENIKDLCSSPIYDRVSGNTTAKVSSYDLLNSYYNAAKKLLDLTEDQWKDSHQNENVIFLFRNFDELFNSIIKIMEVTNNAVVDYRSVYELKSTILYAITWGIPLIIIVPIAIYTFHAMKSELTFMLRTLFGISKSEVSSLRWSMKSHNHVKKRNREKKTALTATNSSVSMLSADSASQIEQENEQLVDTFATRKRSSSNLFSDFLITMAFYLITSCVLSTLAVFIYHSSMENILEMAFGYTNAVNCRSSAVASYVWSQEIFSAEEIVYSVAELKSKGLEYVINLEGTFNDFMFGYDNNMTAAILLGADVVSKYEQATPLTNIDTQYEPHNGFLHATYFSMSCDTQMRMLHSTSLFVLNESDPTIYTFNDEFVYDYEHLIFSHLDYCLREGQELFLAKTNVIETNQEYQLILIFFSLLTFQVIIFFTLLLKSYFDVRRHYQTVRGLMLLIPPEALLKTQSILKWISGTNSFKGRKSPSEIQNNAAKHVGLEFAVNASKCGLIIMNGETEITQVNTSICSLFKCTPEEIKGKKLRALMEENLIDKDKRELFRHFDSNINKLKMGTGSNQFTLNTTKLGSNNQIVYLNITVVGHSRDDDDDYGDEGVAPATSFSAIIVDRTAEHFQEALVESEKKKGESLIASLLPPSIIKRMSDGETDITFEVQVATCLFTSIVGWSDLIKDMNAVQVVSFLNRVFSAFDEELHNFPAITKMKTIGHIYMICGGLFTDSSVNTGQIVTQYALRLLDISEEVSKEIGIPFQITVGVNTGGPLKCGILGVTRPVFDIIGDVVNVASRMNSHCVPGYIQISPTTYDSIKFLQFNIKERGEINVKGKGNMKTYLVSRVSTNFGSLRLASLAKF